jgi:hypothetical protein
MHSRRFKGYDCSIPCLGSVQTPCHGRGTFDQKYMLGDAARDILYDCEPDGSCVCLKGYQGAACEIECKPTDNFHFQNPLGTRLVCECVEGWKGLRCEEPDMSYKNKTLQSSSASKLGHSAWLLSWLDWINRGVLVLGTGPWLLGCSLFIPRLYAT